MNGKFWIWPALLSLSALGVVGFALSDWQSPLRPLVTLGFMVICPGMALVRLTGIRIAVSAWTLAIALSIALDAAIGMALLYAGVWSWQTAALLLAGITLGAVILDWALRSRQAPAQISGVVVIEQSIGRSKHHHARTKKE